MTEGFFLPAIHGLSQAEWDKLRMRRKQIDGYRCMIDGTRGSGPQGKDLHVDHIVPWSMSHDNSVDNLRTLCERHHSMLGYRRTVNPWYILNIFDFQEEDQADRDIDRGFGVLRG